MQILLHKKYLCQFVPAGWVKMSRFVWVRSFFELAAKLARMLLKKQCKQKNQPMEVKYEYGKIYQPQS